MYGKNKVYIHNIHVYLWLRFFSDRECNHKVLEDYEDFDTWTTI